MNTSSKPIKRIGHWVRRRIAYIWLNWIHYRTIQIAVTGSYGKTSTTRAISALLSYEARTVTTDIDLDTIYNVPITALNLRFHKYAVFELGIDRKNEMDFHLSLVKPHISVITGISPVHSDAKHLGSVRNIILEKRKIIERLGSGDFAILNRDDPYVYGMANHTKAKILWYGIHPSSSYRAEDIQIGISKTKFKITTPTESYYVETPLLGEHNCRNLLVAAAVADIFRIPSVITKKVFADLEQLAGRFSVENGPEGTQILNDSLRSNPASAMAGLEFLNALKIEGRKIVIVGEMGELGDLAIPSHKKIGEFIGTSSIDLLVCCGGLTKYIDQGAICSGMSRDKVQFSEDVRNAAEFVSRNMERGDLIYIKGSRLKHMERILLLLRGMPVNCNVISCPFFVDCDDCQYREIGYQPDNDAY